MPNQLTLLTYPFDPTGQALSNRIIGEQHAVQEANYRDYYYIVPTYGPFFENNVVITYTAMDGSHRILTPDVDYYFALPFLGATRSIGVPLFGAIAFNNSIIDGTVSINYRTLGGEWTTDPAAILANLATLMYNPRVALWDVVTNKPAVFPPINHQQSIDTIYGAQAVIDAIHALANTIANSSGTTIVLGSGGGGGPTTTTSDTYAINQDQDRILTGSTLTLDVIGQGAGVPDTLYWSMVMWNASIANFDVVSGNVGLTLNGGVKRGQIQIQCTNTAAIPVGFNVLLRSGNVSGDVVAISDLLFVTKGDMVVAKSGPISNNNQTKTGFVFSNEKNTGLTNPASNILDLVINDETIMRFDEVSNTRTLYFGPNNTFKMVWQPDGSMEILNPSDVVIFTSTDVVSLSYLQSLVPSLATKTYTDNAIDVSMIKKNKLFYLLNT